MASDDPAGTIDDAKPTWRTLNQAAMRAMDGTRIMPLPVPVTCLPKDAERSPVATAVMTMPMAVTARPIVSTILGPSFDASTPPTAAVNV